MCIYINVYIERNGHVEFQFDSKIAKIIINLLQSQICKYDINITVITWFKHLHNFVKSRYQFNLYIYVYQSVYH